MGLVCWEASSHIRSKIPSRSLAPFQPNPGLKVFAAPLEHARHLGRYLKRRGAARHVGVLYQETFPWMVSLGPPARCPFSPLFLVGRVRDPTNIDYRKSWYQLILTSLREDLDLVWDLIVICLDLYESVSFITQTRCCGAFGCLLGRPEGRRMFQAPG